MSELQDLGIGEVLRELAVDLVGDLDPCSAEGGRVVEGTLLESAECVARWIRREVAVLLLGDARCSTDRRVVLSSAGAANQRSGAHRGQFL